MSALAKIHIAKKELCLHDDDYRAILKRVTGQDSAKGLSHDKANALIAEFKRLGWKPKVIAGGKTSAPKRKAPADHPTAMKARALWLSLFHLGEVRNSSESALEAFAARQLKCDRLIWADQQQMYKLIEALKKMAERAGWSQDVSGIKATDQVLILKQRLLRALCAKQDKLDGRHDGATFALVRPTIMTPADLDASINDLGAGIRRMLDEARP